MSTLTKVTVRPSYGWSHYGWRELTDGRVIGAPLTWYPTLLEATARQLRRWKACGAGTGIHWPALDYHLSVEGLLRGAREAEGVTRRLLARV